MRATHKGGQEVIAEAPLAGEPMRLPPCTGTWLYLVTGGGWTQADTWWRRGVELAIVITGVSLGMSTPQAQG